MHFAFGRTQTDSAGAPIATYDNNDVMTFARAWTGFTRQVIAAEHSRGRPFQVR